jgi:hypothetical protein
MAKKDKATAHVVASVHNMRMIPQPLTQTHRLIEESVNYVHGKDFTKDSFHHTLERASRRISEPASRKRRT